MAGFCIFCEQTPCACGGTTKPKPKKRAAKKVSPDDPLRRMKARASVGDDVNATRETPAARPTEVVGMTSRQVDPTMEALRVFAWHGMLHPSETKKYGAELERPRPTGKLQDRVSDEQ